MMVVQLQILGQGRLHFIRIGETGRLNHMGNTPVKPFHHAVGLGVSGRDQPVLNAKACAYLVKCMISGGFTFTLGGKPVSELLAIIGQDRLNPDGAFFV